jgi:PhoH-like ATPase
MIASVEKKQEEAKGNALILDTNVLVRDPEAVRSLMNNGENDVYLGMGVLAELNGLKSRQDIGRDVRKAIRIISELRRENNPNLIFNDVLKWDKKSWLDRKQVDHQILAVARKVLDVNRKDNKYKKIKLISADEMVLIWAMELFRNDKEVEVENYYRDERKIVDHLEPQVIQCDFGQNEDGKIPFDKVDSYKDLEVVGRNEGVVLSCDFNGKTRECLAVKKDGYFQKINWKISAANIKPQSLNGEDKNFSQYFALSQLLDPDIRAVFLLGGAGTGKTLLSLAAAIEQKKYYKNIIVTRPMVPLEGKDVVGFLPGSSKEKIDPYLLPIYQNIDFIKEQNSEAVKSKIQTMFDEEKIIILLLSFIRGASFNRTFLIVDEAQNLTPHQIRTILTRIGKDAKVVFTGDLKQIDQPFLTARSSGLNYAANSLRNGPMIGVTTFGKTVRSELVEYVMENM